VGYFCGSALEIFVHGGDGSHKGWAKANRRLIFQFVPVYGTATATPTFLTLAIEMHSVGYEEE
jgi:hypothetical protein